MRRGGDVRICATTFARIRAHARVQQLEPEAKYWKHYKRFPICMCVNGVGMGLPLRMRPRVLAYACACPSVYVATCAYACVVITCALRVLVRVR
jgi:hypothetical protein